MPPSSNQLETAKEKLLQNKAKSEAVRTKLSDIEMELNRIAEANSLEIHSQVDTARGDNSESDHTRILMELLKKAQEEHALVANAKMRLMNFTRI